MQLAAQGGARLASVHDLHSPPHIHAPPREVPAFVAPHRLRVAAALPFDPSRIGGGLKVASLALRADGTTGDALADAAMRTAARIDQVLEQRFGRDGVDGRGGSIELVVHAPDASNAYWDQGARRIELGDGDGVRWGAFATSASVMAHELYHGVVDAEVRLDYEQAEQAALHESLADVFAAGVVGSWRIGEDVVTPGVDGDAIRDLAHPAIAHLRDARRGGGQPHALSGVASLAAVRAAEQLGDEAVQLVWYRALVAHLRDGAGFTDAARATIDAAAELHGASSAAVRAVTQAWESVGVLEPGAV
jgi:Zn-dependent metalloprotease